MVRAADVELRLGGTRYRLTNEGVDTEALPVMTAGHDFFPQMVLLALLAGLRTPEWWRAWWSKRFFA